METVPGISCLLLSEAFCSAKQVAKTILDNSEKGKEMKFSSLAITARPQSAFVLLSLFTLLLVPGCSTMKGVSIIRGGTTEQAALNTESIEAGKAAHFLTVKVRINDSQEDLNFLVDTGSLTLIDEQTARRFAFEDSVMVESNDSAGNKKDVPLARVGRISVGGVVVYNCAAAIVDLKKIDTQIDGLLGSNFLRHFKVKLDYQNSRVTFLANSGDPQMEGAMIIPFWKNMKYGFAPTMECELDKQVTVDCMVDTGHPEIASIPSSIIHKLPHYKTGEFISSIGDMTGGVLGTGKDSYLVQIDEIASGPLKIEDIPVVSNRFTDKIMTIGYKYLKNFIVIIDYPNSILYLKPNSELSTYNKYMSFGFSVAKDGEKTVVKGMWQGSSADKSGLSIGDELLSFNDYRTSDLSMIKIIELINSSDSLEISYIEKPIGLVSRIVLHKEDLAMLFNHQ